METLILIIVLAVFFVVVVAETGWLLLVRPRRRRGAAPTEVVSPPEAPSEPELLKPGRDAADDVHAVIAPPRRREARSNRRPRRWRSRPLGGTAHPAARPAVAFPVVGRLGTSGAAVPGRLDDDTWDEIEEVLIIADVGVAPAQQIVDDLRTQVKVLGVRGPDEVRALLRSELIKQIARTWTARCGTSATMACPR